MKGIVTGTTTGIGAELSAWFKRTLCAEDNPYIGITLYHGNRREIEALSTSGDGSYACRNVQSALDMSSKESIERFVKSISIRTETDAISLLILNAGIRATRKTVDWDGVQLNRCRVVNAVANNYLIKCLVDSDLLSPDVKIVFTGSIMHWDADHDPFDARASTKASSDPTNAAWAKRQYANSKLALFFLAKQWAVKIPGADIRIVNPGMVVTKIFRESQSYGFVTRSREWLSMTTADAVNIMVRWIAVPREHQNQVQKSSVIKLPVLYFTPFQAWNILKLHAKAQMLQDVVGHRFLRLHTTATENYSPLVRDATVETNYGLYIDPSVVASIE